MTKQIKITRCCDTNKGSVEEWYKYKIGEVFDIYIIGDYYYWVKYINDKGNKAMNFINMRDVL